jgi:hypothetical protein
MRARTPPDRLILAICQSIKFLSLLAWIATASLSAVAVNNAIADTMAGRRIGLLHESSNLNLIIPLALLAWSLQSISRLTRFGYAPSRSFRIHASNAQREASKKWEGGRRR